MYLVASLLEVYKTVITNIEMETFEIIQLYKIRRFWSEIRFRVFLKISLVFKENEIFWKHFMSFLKKNLMINYFKELMKRFYFWNFVSSNIDFVLKREKRLLMLKSEKHEI